ncbi:hypothetical protein [Streptomyces sp. I8-5]|uniref:hypothetical protein n=1 Tax=Streptomyces sp. I8-5 TaxID=3104277 RepID=UPI003869F3E1
MAQRPELYDAAGVDPFTAVEALLSGPDRMTSPDDPGKLPPVATLSRGQQHGTHCVWCSVALSAGTAVDLSARETDVSGNTVQWFPRCCINCRDGHPG